MNSTNNNIISDSAINELAILKLDTGFCLSTLNKPAQNLFTEYHIKNSKTPIWNILTELDTILFRKALQQAYELNSTVVHEVYFPKISAFLRFIITYSNNEYLCIILKQVIDKGVVLVDSKFKIISFNGVAEKIKSDTFGKKLQKDNDLREYLLPLYHKELLELLDKLDSIKKSEEPIELMLKTPTKNYYISINPVLEDGDKEVVGYVFNYLENKPPDTIETVANSDTDLKNRNRDLEQFSYIVSHNLKSSIAKIKGLVTLLRMNTEEKDRNFMYNSIDSSVKQLENTVADVNEFIVFNKDISDKKQIINLPELLKGVLIDLEANIEKSQAKIISDFSKSETVYGYKPYVQSVFYNLISNSIKYARPGITPEIKISSEKLENSILIKFIDNGKGIDLIKHKNDVFGLYKRFDTNPDGKGLGLFMVKSQVIALSGTIEIFSEQEKGTEFRITLPLMA